MNDERQLTEAILRKYKHPLSAIRHLLTMYDTLPVASLTRMSRNILFTYPPIEYGPMPSENRAVFEEEVRQRERNLAHALTASRIPILVQDVVPRSFSRARSTRRRRRSSKKSLDTSPVVPTPSSDRKARGFFETLFD